MKCVNAVNEALNIGNVVVSGEKYIKLKGVHDKHTCPICSNSPDVIYPNIQESTCFKDMVKWEYN